MSAGGGGSNTPFTTVGDYIIGHEIGRGSFATVYMAKSISTGRPVAVKSVSRDKLNRKLAENLETEIKILKGIQHDHVVALLDIMKTEKHIHLIMEYCSLGDLSHYIKRRGLVAGTTLDPGAWNPLAGTWGGLNQIVVRHFLRQLASAMEFLRAHSLIHRDLKPQNVLLCPAPDDAPQLRIPNPSIPGSYVTVPPLPILKLADFGFARALPQQSLASTLCGSPLYMAPEILRGDRYDAKADLWSFGAILYEMVTGRPPFKAQNHIDLLRKIERGEGIIRFPGDDMVSMVGRRSSTIMSSSPGGRIIGGGSPSSSPRFPHVQGGQPISDDLKDLIRKLLKRNPAERLTFEAFFAHPSIISNRAVNQSPSQGVYNPDQSYRTHLRRSSSSSQKSNLSYVPPPSPLANPPFAVTTSVAESGGIAHVAISENAAGGLRGHDVGGAQLPIPTSMNRVHTSPATTSSGAGPSDLRRMQTTTVLGMAHPDAVPHHVSPDSHARQLGTSPQQAGMDARYSSRPQADHTVMKFPINPAQQMRYNPRVDMQRQTSAPVVGTTPRFRADHPNPQLSQTAEDDENQPSSSSDLKMAGLSSGGVPLQTGFDTSHVPPFSSISSLEKASGPQLTRTASQRSHKSSTADEPATVPRVEPPFPGYAEVDPSIFDHDLSASETRDEDGAHEEPTRSVHSSMNEQNDAGTNNNNSSLSSLGSIEFSDADADDTEEGAGGSLNDDAKSPTYAGPTMSAIAPHLPPRPDEIHPQYGASPRLTNSNGSDSDSASGSGSGATGRQNIRGSLEEYVVVEKRVVEVNWLADEVAGAVESISAKNPTTSATSSNAATVAHHQPPVTRTSSGGYVATTHEGYSPMAIPVPVSTAGLMTGVVGATSTGSPQSPRSLRLETQTSGRIFGSLRESTHQFLNASNINPGSSTAAGGTASAGTTPPAAYIAAASAAQTPTSHLSSHIPNQIHRPLSPSTLQIATSLPQPPTENPHPLLEPLNLCALRGHAVQQLADTILTSAQTALQADEALACYLLALRCYQIGMEVAKNVWEARQAGVDLRVLSTAVQWVRERFNECLEAAEVCRRRVEAQMGDEPVERRCVERIVYDRALEVSRAAALEELSPSPQSTSSSHCEALYRHCILLVEALLLSDDTTPDVSSRPPIINTLPPSPVSPSGAAAVATQHPSTTDASTVAPVLEESLSDEDRRVLERFVASLWARVSSVARKPSSAAGPQTHLPTPPQQQGYTSR
ncbi:hypothetical protein DFS34DRAFT_116130 [Phlyctochytrium arcticum]|nr:hypothetical protein DFS34DRAFT_116130 [Phlyctochytrium arcticum]